MAGEWLAGLGARPYRFFAEIGSTNDVARAWVLEGAPEGALVIADEQTAGRGRYQRTWQAAPQSSLLLSLILRPALPPEKLPRVTVMGAVALAETLAAWGLRPGIKWPNDVQLEGRKVAGILAEAVWQGSELAGVVLGMGVNVCRDALPAEAAAAFHATTVEDALGREPERAALLVDLVARLDGWRQRLDDPALLAAWRSYNVLLGQHVTALVGEERVAGVAEEIDAEGALILRLADGTPRRLLAGDVTLQAG